MAQLEVTVKVNEAGYKVGQAVVNFVGAIKEALANGWQVGEDLPAIAAAALNDLGPVLSEVPELDDAWSEDAAALTKALGLSVADLAGLFVKKA